MSESYTVQGKVTFISETELVGAKNHEKRYAIVEEQGGDYPQTYKVEFFGKRHGLSDDINEGDTATIKCNVNGRPYTRRDNGLPDSYMSLGAYDVSVDSAPAQPTAPAQPDPHGTADALDNLPMGDDAGSDLPF